MIIKEVKIGSFGIKLTIGDRIVETVRSNICYRLLIRPVRRFLSSFKNAMENNDKKVSQLDEPSCNRKIITSEGTPEQKTILQRISEVEWYHSIDLGHGVVTPGLMDLQPSLTCYHLPENLNGMRVLDVATYDGFWAFEFEKRGATEVVAMDIGTWEEIDIPPSIREKAPKEMLEFKTGTGFNIAKDLLASKVQRKIMNVYDLTPEWMGKFDFVFCSDLLLHLMNPMKALQNIHSVVSGCAYITDVFNTDFGEDDSNPILRYIGGSGRMVWWDFSLSCLKRMITDAGFNNVEMVSKFEFSVQGRKEKYWHVVFKAYP